MLARSGPGVRRAQPRDSGDAPRVARRGGDGRALLALLVAWGAGGSTGWY